MEPPRHFPGGAKFSEEETLRLSEEDSIPIVDPLPIFRVTPVRVTPVRVTLVRVTLVRVTLVVCSPRRTLPRTRAYLGWSNL